MRWDEVERINKFLVQITILDICKKNHPPFNHAIFAHISSCGHWVARQYAHSPFRAFSRVEEQRNSLQHKDGQFDARPKLEGLSAYMTPWEARIHEPIDRRSIRSWDFRRIPAPIPSPCSLSPHCARSRTFDAVDPSSGSRSSTRSLKVNEKLNNLQTEQYLTKIHPSRRITASDLSICSLLLYHWAIEAMPCASFRMNTRETCMSINRSDG